MLASSLMFVGMCIVVAADLLIQRPPNLHSSTWDDQRHAIWFITFVFGAFAAAMIVYDFIIDLRKPQT
jgi:hypothetical protein